MTERKDIFSLQSGQSGFHQNDLESSRSAQHQDVDRRYRAEWQLSVNSSGGRSAEMRARCWSTAFGGNFAGNRSAGCGQCERFN